MNTFPTAGTDPAATTRTDDTARRARAPRTAAPLLALLLSVSACGQTSSPAPPTAPASAPAGATPVELDIPSIGVHVTDLGTSVSRSVTCPADPNTVAWSTLGTLPGEPGLAQMSASVRGVFQKLSGLGSDDPIVVKLSDGSQVTFKKVGVNSVIPNTPSASLQLTACGGSTAVDVYADRVP